MIVPEHFPVSAYIPYFWRRVRPFLFLFLCIETLTRAFFTAYDFSNMDAQAGQLARAFMAGFVFDLAVFSYFLVPVTLALLLPAGGARRYILCALYSILAYVFLFTAVSEFFFWEEFSTRFNFIAVDYLVYTTEVIDNIVQSYPVMPLLCLIGVMSGLLGWRYWRRQGISRYAPPLRARVCGAASSVVLACAAFICIPAGLSDVGNNRYVNEVAKNGIYELFSAFRHNELDYAQFYTMGDERTLLPILQSRLHVTAPVAGAPLARTVRYSGKAKPYNVVLVTVESLSASYLGAFGNKKGLTPFLDRLSRDSLFFTNMYATGTRTVYGLSAISLSIPPLPGNSIVRRPDNENLFTLGGVLRRHGYSSTFLYGGYGYFDNMNYFFGHNGYDIVDRASFDDSEVTFANAWGVADEDLYRKAAKEADKAYAQAKPFFQMLMTTSNHRPFTYPDGRIDIPSPGRRSGAVKYTDYALEQLITEARKHPWFDNTIFVIVADHTASSAGKEQLEPDKYHIPMFIYAPALIKPARIDRMVSQLDIAPTVMGLLNISYESRFYGQDVLDRKPDPERAFISNYQQLGYISKDSLVVLKPVRQEEYYTRGKDGKFVRTAKTQSLLDEALGYYQSATYWKDWSRNP